MGKFFRKVHIELSLFFLPIALLYALSGSLYLSGYKQDSGASIHHFTLPSIQKDELPGAINAWLTQNNLKPINNTELRKYRGDLLMGSAKYEAVIKESENSFKIKIVERSFLGNLIMLHEGKGEWYFNILAYGFAVSLVIFYLSGLVMTGFANRHRGRALSVVILGFASAFILGYMSL